MRLVAPFGRCVALGVVLALAGCGDGDRDSEGALRLEIVTASADGTPPAALALRGEDGHLRPLSASTPGTHEAKGPSGKYELVAPEGWGVVGTRERLSLTAGGSPTPVPVGRARAIYLIPREGVLPTGETTVVRRAPDGDEQPVSGAQSMLGADRRLVVRLGPGVAGPVRVYARLEGGLAAAPVDVSIPADGAPTGSALAEGPTAPLDVLVFRATDGGPAPDVPVAVEGEAGPYLARAEGRSDAGGIARLEKVSLLPPVTRIALGTGEPATRVESETSDWILLGRARVLWIEAAPAEQGEIGLVAADAGEGPGAAKWAEGLRVEALPPGGPSYARVATREASESGTPGDPRRVVRLPKGRWRLLVTAGRRYAFVEHEVTDGFATLRVALSDLCSVEGRLAGSATPGIPTRVTFSRLEGEREVLAQAFEVPVGGDGTFRASLPAGVYTVASARGGEPSATKKTLHLEKPGTTAFVDLPAR